MKKSKRPRKVTSAIKVAYKTNVNRWTPPKKAEQSNNNNHERTN